MKLRSKHSETIQQLKAQFLRDKREYQQDSENKISSLERKANTVSFVFKCWENTASVDLKCFSIFLKWKHMGPQA